VKPCFVEQALDLLDREIRDRLVEFPRNDDQVKLFEQRLYHAYRVPVQADQEHCAHALTVLDDFLRQHVRLIYAPAPNACADEYGRFRSDGTMWIRPGAPARMLQTMVHEMGHMYFASTGIPHQALSDNEHEFIAESVGYCVLRALGVDTLEHSTAYLTPNCLNGEFPPGRYRELIVMFVQKILRLFQPSDLKGIA
jgi:hypothetical protein